MKDNYFNEREKCLAESFGMALCVYPLYYHRVVIDGKRHEYYSNRLELGLFPEKNVGAVTLHECYQLTQKQIVDLVHRFAKYSFIKPLSYGKKD